MPRWRPRIFAPVDWRAVAWTLVPGLGHLRLREQVLGYALLATWAGLLLLALLNFPSPLSAWLGSFAICVHAAAFVSMFAANLSFEWLIVRVVFGVVVLILLNADNKGNASNN